MELTKKQLIKLVQFASGENISPFTWEAEAEDVVNKYLKAINFTDSSLELCEHNFVRLDNKRIACTECSQIESRDS